MQGKQPDACPEEYSASKKYRADVVVSLAPVENPQRGAERWRKRDAQHGKPDVGLQQALLGAGEVLLGVTARVCKLYDVLCIDRLAASCNHRCNVLAIHGRLDVERQIVRNDLLRALAQRLDDLRPPHELLAGQALLQLRLVEDQELVTVRRDDRLRVDVPVRLLLAWSCVRESEAEGGYELVVGAARDSHHSLRLRAGPAGAGQEAL
mmetsp:Transcript_39221/g.110197  ORF Transcript_39221/g.110197 Transcript_39221/m.110197 type:complete len:208 (+) Transcript_39221:288-911(+)